MRKYASVTIVSILFVLLVVSFISNQRLMKNIVVLKAKNSLLEKHREIRNENSTYEMINSTISLNDLIVVSSKGDTIEFGNIPIKNDDSFKLILKCDKTNCESCMKEVSYRLKDFYENNNVKGDVIIIDKYTNQNDIRVNSNFWGIDDIYGVVKDVDYGDFEIDKTYFLIVDKELRVRDVYIPNAYEINEIDNYLKTFSMLLDK